jgi:hypothetical protein
MTTIRLAFYQSNLSNKVQLSADPNKWGKMIAGICKVKGTVAPDWIGLKVVLLDRP